jgi:hypothetical protein
MEMYLFLITPGNPKPKQVRSAGATAARMCLKGWLPCMLPLFHVLGDLQF